MSSTNYIILAITIRSTILQLAALQLIERGKLELETPVSRYLQEFENCIILDDPFSANSTFKPATQAVRVKHLLNFTSGLFYTKNVPMDRQLIAYSAPHDKNDPIGEFFSLIKVTFLVGSNITVTSQSYRVTYQASPFNSSQAQIASSFCSRR